MAGFYSRSKNIVPFLSCCFGLGILMAIFQSEPKYILSLAIALFFGMLIIGPISTVIQHWTITLINPSPHASSLVAINFIIFLSFIVAYTTLDDKTQIFLSVLSSVAGSILGHDATVAVTNIKQQIDQKMIAIFPIFLVMALFAGYSSFGFLYGVYKFAKSLLN